MKEKASDFFQPLQLGVTCSAGFERVVHSLRNMIDSHWKVEDFAVMKIMLSILFLGRHSSLSVCLSFLSLHLGQRGAMVHIHYRLGYSR